MPAKAEGEAVLEHRAAQREQAKRATYEALRAKKRQEKEFTLVLTEGEDAVSFLFRAIGAQDYDKLVTKCPATTEQVANGASFDQNRFAPLLLSRVCVEPVLDEAEWREIWVSPEWNRGEISTLFFEAVNLCNRGPDVNPIGAG